MLIAFRAMGKIFVPGAWEACPQGPEQRRPDPLCRTRDKRPRTSTIRIWDRLRYSACRAACPTGYGKTSQIMRLHEVAGSDRSRKGGPVLQLLHLDQHGVKCGTAAHVAQPVAGERVDIVASRRGARPVQIGRHHARWNAVVHTRAQPQLAAAVVDPQLVA